MDLHYDVSVHFGQTHCRRVHICVAGHVLQGLSDSSREGVRNMARRRAWRKRVHEPQPRRRVAHQLAEHLVQAYPRVRAGLVRFGDSLDRG